MDFSLDIKRLKKTFDKVAQHYDHVAVLQRQIADSMLTRMDVMTITPKTILEIGSATAYASRQLEKKFKKAQVFSLDFSANMLKQAKKQKKFFSKQQFVLADANRLPFKDNSMDMIFSNLLLHWLDDINSSMKEWQRVLKPEGVLMFSCFGPDTLQELRQSFTAIDDAPHVHQFLDMHDIGDAVFHAGFVNPVFDVEYFQLTYKNLKQLFKELKQSGYQNQEKQRHKGLMGKEAFAKLQKAYKHYVIEDNVYPASYEIIYGHGWGSEKQMHKQVDVSEHTIPISNIRRGKRPSGI